MARRDELLVEIARGEAPRGEREMEDEAVVEYDEELLRNLEEET